MPFRTYDVGTIVFIWNYRGAMVELFPYLGCHVVRCSVPLTTFLCPTLSVSSIHNKFRQDFAMKTNDFRWKSCISMVFRRFSPFWRSQFLIISRCTPLIICFDQIVRWFYKKYSILLRFSEILFHFSVFKNKFLLWSWSTTGNPCRNFPLENHDGWMTHLSRDWFFRERPESRLS